MLTTSKTSLLTLLALLLSTILFAQSPSQTRKWKKFLKSCDCPEFDQATGFLKLLDIGKSPNEIEIRLSDFNMGYTNYSIISHNKGQYKAVYYATRLPANYFHTTQIPKKLYNRYQITSPRLDTILNKIVQLGVSKWEDPGVAPFTVSHLGMMQIQYKIKSDTGSYQFKPPHRSIKNPPNLEAYENISKIVGLFKAMTDSVHRIDVEQRSFKN